MTVYVYRPQEGDKHLLDSQWIYLLKAFGVEEITREEIGDLPVVVIQPESGRYVQATESLADYQHPTVAVYMFGPSHGFMKEADLAGLNVVARVYISTNPDWEFFAQQAAAIVLWDRMVSSG